MTVERRFFQEGQGNHKYTNGEGVILLCSWTFGRVRCRYRRRSPLVYVCGFYFGRNPSGSVHRIRDIGVDPGGGWRVAQQVPSKIDEAGQLPHPRHARRTRAGGLGGRRSMKGTQPAA